jgi:nitric oxide reductase NorE protein
MEQPKNAIFYPPGGILIWFLIILEMFTFLGGILVFMYYRKIEFNQFEEAQSELNPLIGTVNTLILIISGYFAANCIRQIKTGNSDKAAKSIFLSMILGILFLAVKSYEYSTKTSAGTGFGESTFFSFYWLLTGFHFVHVLFGIGLLFFMYRGISKKKYNQNNYFDVETSAAYWHLCDLIWILIFPVIYLS